MPAQFLDTVQKHGAENYQSEDDFLGVAFDAGQVHAGLDDGDDESADQRSQDSALASGQACAPDNHGGDDVKFVHQAVSRRTALQFGGRDDAAQSGKTTAASINED